MKNVIDLLQGRVGIQREFEVLLGGVFQGDLIDMEPVSELDGSPDVRAVADGGAVGIAGAFGSATCVAEHAPLGGGADDAELVPGKRVQCVGAPELELSEVFLSAGRIPVLTRSSRT
jgi:hypothetical protein